VRGFKHFPQDLEQTAEQQHAAIRPGSVAALAVPGDATGDRVVLVAEVDRRKLDGPDAGDRLIAALRRATADLHGVQLHGAALVPAGTLPKRPAGNSSAACRDAWMSATLPTLKAMGAA
jgi:acyl-CoA synthetase (AMP-forming)/AMP-acid ligase II